MLFKKLFSKPHDLKPAELKDYLDSHEREDFTLLDVRQPSEYREEHLPGAFLVPLAELKGKVDELDPKKPTIVYCAVGGRSRAAAQYLQGLGFEEVYNLTGGIKAWQGLVAKGPRDWGLELADEAKSAADLIDLAWGLEEGLARVYRSLAEELGQGPVAGLLRELAAVEDRHQERLAGLWADLPPGETEGRDLNREREPRLEGGWTVPEFLAKYQNALADEEAALNLAMTVEAQALDLYLRLGRLDLQEAARGVLWNIAEEEQAHLKALAQRLDRVLENPTGRDEHGM